ncbi:MAG: hypothetical protein PHH00_04235 [Candidatus Nanoarchaeia archaeon]|nr:hypothetical protein [Candidatus Nanoarchaeia archaeon]
MPDMTPQETNDRMWAERFKRQDELARKKESTDRQRVYANKVRLRDLDLVIQTVEYLLETAKTPYRKREITEKGRERRQRTSYLTELLSAAELSHPSTSFQ